jgi:peptidyl-tRNA hydrolase
MTEPRFYIIMREDLANMNPGKGIAQGSHAQAAFMWDKMHKEKFASPVEKSAFEDWIEQGHGFGTTIVLSAPLATIEEMVAAARADHLTLYSAGMVKDTSYPDINYYGKRFVHSTYTCGWFFWHEEVAETKAAQILATLPLHQ